MDEQPSPPPAAPEAAAEPAAVVVLPPVASWALTCLALLALLAALYFARVMVLPVVFALILKLVFAPVVRDLKRLHIPELAGAALVVLGLLTAFGAGAYTLAEPAGAWLEKVPQGLRDVSVKLHGVAGSFKGVTSAGEQVQEMASDRGAGEKSREVTMKTPSLARTVLGGARDFAVSAAGTLILLYFFLASGDLFLHKVIAASPRLADQQRAIDISRQVESEVSTYLFTVTTINVALGCAVALAMYALGVPNPALWGAMVGTFNFVPYLGDIASFAVLTLVGLLSFDELWRGLLVPAVLFLLTAAEGYVITPLVLGHRLQLNPVVIVLSVVFWGWMWGVLGALLAVPLLVVLKTFCDHVDSWRAFGEFLGE